jgi:hypothetical protein
MTTIALWSFPLPLHKIYDRALSLSLLISSFCHDLATLALIFFLLASQETYSMTSSLTSQLSFALLINDN